MTRDQFIAKYTNQKVDFDGAFGVQCMDLMHQYVYDVCGLIDKKILAAPFARNVFENYNNIPGHEFFTKINNTPDGVPQVGDIIFWGAPIGRFIDDNGKVQYAGHVAIFLDGDANNFRSFDANWPTGTLPHIQGHNYDGVIGWLRFSPPQINPPIGNGMSPIPDGYQSPEQIVIDAYIALTNQSPNDDEKRDRLARRDNTVDLIRSLTGDGRFYNLFVRPAVEANVRAALELQAQSIGSLTQQAIEQKKQLDTALEQYRILEGQYNQLKDMPRTDEGLRTALKNILYGKGWWWTKWSAIKQLVPNT